MNNTLISSCDCPISRILVDKVPKLFYFLGTYYVVLSNDLNS